MESQSDAQKGNQNDDRLTINTGRLLRAASKMMNQDADGESEALETLDVLECTKCRQCAHCSSNINALTNTIRSTMLEINENKERHRERRHREFIEVLEKYLGNDNRKGHEILRNIKIEDYPVSNSNSETEARRDEPRQVSNKIKAPWDISQSPTPIRNMQSDSVCENNNVGVPPTKSIKPNSSINTKVLKHNIDIQVEKPLNQRDELVAMRQKMLEMQRRKMEDRERKKRKNKKI